MRTSIIATIIFSMFLMGNVTKSHAGEAYLFVENIPGGATEQRHKGWLKIQGYSWGGRQVITSNTGKVRGSLKLGKVILRDLSVEMYLNSAFPKLALALAQGRHIKQVILEEVHPTTKVTMLKITLDGVVVSGVELGADNKQVPTVKVDLSYGKIKWNYTVLDQRTGKVKGQIESGWDTKTQRAR